jgi:hypothetical protein
MPKKEKYWGVVVDNQDPELRGRLVINCPDIVRGDVLDWVDPGFHFVDSAHSAGAVWIPSVGSDVEVEIEAEDDSEVSSLEPKWICNIYPYGTLPEEFQTNYPNRRGWKTKSGHVLFFDDTEDNLEFRLIHPSGTNLVVDNDGNVQINAASGKNILIGDGADQFLVRGDELNTWITTVLKTIYNAHTHSYTGGTTGTPSAPLTDPPSTILSSSNKVK